MGSACLVWWEALRRGSVGVPYKIGFCGNLFVFHSARVLSLELQGLGGSGGDGQAVFPEYTLGVCPPRAFHRKPRPSALFLSSPSPCP